MKKPILRLYKKWPKDQKKLNTTLKTIFKAIDVSLEKEFLTKDLQEKKETQDQYQEKVREIFKKCGYRWDDAPSFSFQTISRHWGTGLSINAYLKGRDGLPMRVGIE